MNVSKLRYGFLVVLDSIVVVLLKVRRLLSGMIQTLWPLRQSGAALEPNAGILYTYTVA